MTSVELLDHTQDPEVKIGLFASVCYDSDTSTEACLRRAKSCVNRGHLATLRFAYATFKISGISRACSHQLVRSKHLDYLQESQRYVKQTELDYIVPPALSSSVTYKNALDELTNIYNYFLELGIKKEDARFILPNAAPTTLIVTGNFQAWLDFIKLRSDPAAQWEIRNVANQVKEALYRIAPNIFTDHNCG